MGWVIVEFPECREVLVDNKSQGHNRDETGSYRVLIVDDGLHTFCLGGAADCQPPSQDIVVANTSLMAPLRLVFAKA